MNVVIIVHFYGRVRDLIGKIAWSPFSSPVIQDSMKLSAKHPANIWLDIFMEVLKNDHTHLPPVCGEDIHKMAIGQQFFYL